MAIIFTFFALMVALPLFVLLVHAQDQSGFISIDCGIQEDYNYTDRTTGIKYISDAGFIDTGVINSIQPGYEIETSEEQFWNLRSFPEGVRNCYTIRLQGGNDQRYLIRVRFMYGNYDNKQQVPIFDLYLGVDRWDTIILEHASNAVTKELIHVPPLDYIQICLINTGFGIPFISALEIRPMNNRTYVAASGSLKLHQRLDFGLESNRSVRYANDIYDRIWSAANFSICKSIASSNVSIEPNTYEPASVVLQTACEPTNRSQPLQLSWKTEDITAGLYMYMHFAEIHQLKRNESRAFNISVNGLFWYGPLVPSYLSTITVFSISGVTAESGGGLLVSINKTENSTLPPIINAIEIFIEQQFPQLQTNQIEIDALLKIKSTYNVKKNWQGDPCYPREFSWAGLDCSYNGERQPNITSLNMSSSGLAGEISLAISDLTMLQFLDLSNNKLNGTVPDFLAKLPNLTVLDLSNNNLNGTIPDFLAKLPNLRVLNLENNNLSGTMPLQLMQRSKNETLSLSAGGNPFLCLSEPCSKNKEKGYVIPLAASLGGSTLILLIGCAIFWSQRRKKKQGQLISESDKKGGTIIVPEKKQFTYSEILSITNNFERLIGKGGFGTVYLGYLDGRQVSVKMLSPASVQGYKQFQKEAQLLIGVHHGNLTTILGYCNEDTQLGLVYEYMENGNLADHLSEKSNHILTWKERLGIALDAAQGLEYLHFGCKPPVIHRDIKSTNILLDENFRAKLADFGMSKAFQLQDGSQASVVVGTPGYLDPDYIVTGKLNETSDVFSFGVVLLEITTGRQALAKSQDKTHIIEWVSSMLKEGEIKNIVDPKLELDIDSSSISKVVELAMNCVSSSPTERPTMTRVVMELKQCLAISENSREIHETSLHELFSVASITEAR